VWTAFITQYLATPRWIRRPESKVVVLRELPQTIFMFAADYTPQKTSRGEHILQFTNRAGKFFPSGVNADTDVTRCPRVRRDHCRAGEYSLATRISESAYQEELWTIDD
jgi:hypothetical protein